VFIPPSRSPWSILPTFLLKHCYSTTELKFRPKRARTTKAQPRPSLALSLSIVHPPATPGAQSNYCNLFFNCPRSSLLCRAPHYTTSPRAHRAPITSSIFTSSKSVLCASFAGRDLVASFIRVSLTATRTHHIPGSIESRGAASLHLPLDEPHVKLSLTTQ
jgi:hypothetical protein